MLTWQCPQTDPPTGVGLSHNGKRLRDLRRWIHRLIQSRPTVPSGHAKPPARTATLKTSTQPDDQRAASEVPRNSGTSCRTLQPENRDGLAAAGDDCRQQDHEQRPELRAVNATRARTYCFCWWRPSDAGTSSLAGPSVDGPGRCWCSVCCQIAAKNDQDSFIASPRVPQYGLRCSRGSITRHVPTESRSFLIGPRVS